MKKLIICLIAITFLNCKSHKECGCVPPPMGSGLNGTWKLTKIVYGFSQFSVSGDKMPFQENVQFDITNSKYHRIQDGRLVDESKISLEQDKNNQLIINYLSDNTYQIYSILAIDNKTTLSLYQRTIKGAVIADGSTFFYEKQ